MVREIAQSFDESGARARSGTKSSARKTYHHGDLREALIDATRQLVIEKGAENFSLADACRRAGVSTAAPYKHFKDRNEILKAVCMSAFEDLAKRGISAAQAAGETTMAGVIELHLAYLDMAIEQPSLFRLMFGQNPAVKEDETVHGCGQACFQAVLGQMSLYCRANNVQEEPLEVFMRTWSFVHGVASLRIDGDYDAVMPGFDDRALVAATIPRLIAREFSSSV